MNLQQYQEDTLKKLALQVIEWAEHKKSPEFLEEAIKSALKGQLEVVVGALTSDISNSDFNDNGRKSWEIKQGSDRGIEPCIECDNSTKIRSLLTTPLLEEIK